MTMIISEVGGCVSHQQHVSRGLRSVKVLEGSFPIFPRFAEAVCRRQRVIGLAELSMNAAAAGRSRCVALTEDLVLAGYADSTGAYSPATGVVAFDLTTGRESWRVALPGEPYSVCEFGGGHCFLSVGHVTCIGNSGNLLWQYALPVPGGEFARVVGSELWIGGPGFSTSENDRGRLWVVDSSGLLIWETDEITRIVDVCLGPSGMVHCLAGLNVYDEHPSRDKNGDDIDEHATAIFTVDTTGVGVPGLSINHHGRTMDGEYYALTIETDGVDIYVGGPEFVRATGGNYNVNSLFRLSAALTPIWSHRQLESVKSITFHEPTGYLYARPGQTPAKPNVGQITSETVYCYDRADGSEKWRYDLAGELGLNSFRAKQSIAATSDRLAIASDATEELGYVMQ